MPPNIFHFATSELSQDAALCWLLAWAKPEHLADSTKLHRVGTDLLGLIYAKAGVPKPSKITSVEVRKQVSGIDILCVVNGDCAIIIEDKVGTKQHSEQLPRYKDHVSTELGFLPHHMIPVYIQTGDESNYAEVAKHGYHVINRSDLLTVLESKQAAEAKAESDLLRSFSSHVRHMEDDVMSYLKFPLAEWTWNSWKGFYSHVQRLLGEGAWDYVPNAGGGFLGFWWHFNEVKDCEIYLQLEQERFCFKIAVEGTANRKELRDHWHHAVSTKCKELGLPVTRPGRFGSGTYMTVALLDQEFRIVDGNGLIDMDKTVGVLRSAQAVIDALEAEAAA